MSGETWKCRAAFILTPGGPWVWRVWEVTGAARGNKHAAIFGKASELGAVGWDFSQADFDAASRFRF